MDEAQEFYGLAAIINQDPPGIDYNHDAEWKRPVTDDTASAEHLEAAMRELYERTKRELG